MFTRYVIFLLLDFYQNSIEAAVPIEIVTEKSTAERLVQQFPFIIPMIPDKVPLLSARREKEPLAEPFFFLETTLQAPGNSSISQNINATVARTQTIAEPEKVSIKSQNQTAITSEKETLKSQTPKISTGNPSSPGMMAKKKPVPQTPKKEQHISSNKMSRKKRLFSQRRRMFEQKQRQKRSVKETITQEQTKPDKVPLKLHKTFDKDPMTISQNVEQKRISERELTGQEEISAEENMLRRNHYGKYGNNAWYDSRYQVWHYDSGYVDYDIPFPMAGYKIVNKQKGLAQGAEIAVAQVLPILKSMVLGKSSLTKKPHKFFP